MNQYNTEQFNAISMASEFLLYKGNEFKNMLLEKAADYLSFRKDVENFHSMHFNEICTRKCYDTKLSACCSKEGIITFFGDVVVNQLVFTQMDETDALLARLNSPTQSPDKCVYLGCNGCSWKLKPIVCEMFICDPAKNKVFNENPNVESQWDNLIEEAKTFKWPDRPVLFDYLEEVFLNAGYRSSLMYLHNSPGLLRVKKMAGEAQGKAL